MFSADCTVRSRACSYRRSFFAAIGCGESSTSTDPPGGGTLATASGTGSLILGENVLGYAPIPGLSVALTSPAGTSTELLIETDGGIQVNSLFVAAVCFTAAAVFVDDAPVGPGRRVGVTNTPDILYNVGSFGFSVTTVLSPGTRTITVRAKPFTPLAGVQCYVSSAAEGSTLPGPPKLQAVLNVVRPRTATRAASRRAPAPLRSPCSPDRCCG